MKRTLVLLAAASLMIACGGGDEPPPTATPGGPGAPPRGYQGGPVTDGGSISGTVSYAGQPAANTGTVTKDEAVCAAHGKTIEEHSLVVNDGKVKNVVVWIDGTDSGKEVSPETITVDNVDCMFEPRVSLGYKGEDVKAVNSDPVLHNTHLWLGDKEKSMWNVALPSEGMEIEKPLKKTGIHKITCDAHEWMTAWVYVTDHPYAQVTAEDGSFELDDVPPGDYTLKIWHETLGEQEQSVTIAANGTATANVTYQ